MTTQTPWYRTGTVAVTAGSKSVAGTGLAWQSQVLAGDLFGLTDANGNLTTALAEVESVGSDTALTLKSQWPGSTLSGQKYAIIRNFTGSLPADLAARLSKLIAQYQISVDELTELLTSSGTVTLTTLTGETVSVQGMAGITTRLTAVESALAAKLDDSKATAAGLALLGAADVAAQRNALGLANHQLVTVDTAGNLGLGVTPSDWYGTIAAMQFGTSGSIEGRKNNNSFLAFGANYYLNSSANNTYIASAAAAKYVQDAGSHQWFTAPYGTAGNAISFTQAMTLNASGRLLLNKTDDDGVNIAQFAGSISTTKGVTVPNCADDAAAAVVGVPVGAIYRTGTTLKVRAA